MTILQYSQGGGRKRNRTWERPKWRNESQQQRSRMESNQSDNDSSVVATTSAASTTGLLQVPTKSQSRSGPILSGPSSRWTNCAASIKHYASSKNNNRNNNRSWKRGTSSSDNGTDSVPTEHQKRPPTTTKSNMTWKHKHDATNSSTATTQPQVSSTETLAEPNKKLTKVGPNRLVAPPKDSSTAVAAPFHKQLPKKRQYVSTKQRLTHVHKHQPPNNRRSGKHHSASIQRIRMKSPVRNDNDNDTNDNTAATTGKKHSNNHLSHHAYKKTSTQLIRHNPDSSTPACVYDQCHDRQCRFRHDICSSWKAPNCTYFQRHGLCLKDDDCPYRHVKVSRAAPLCPSFVRLRYCPNPDCALLHRKQVGP